jgi:hypothetical protein
MDIVRGLALFCEDIREEVSGQNTLVGIMADNIAVPSTPVMLARLGIYTRVYFHISNPPEAVSAIAEMPSGEKFELGGASAELVKASFDAAKSNNAQVAGIILKGLFSPLPILGLGAINAIVSIGGRQHILGTLNVIIDPAASASPPPSLQSQPAAPAS